MPRCARSKSSTGMYHCILRGVDKQDIFLDSQDKRKFIKEIKNTKEKYKYDLYAYCLMDNHVHMIIKENENELSKLVHSLTTRYSAYINKKYDRTGHLFENRYFSKPVETEHYLLTLQRYIHQNPPNMQRYYWSSYREYVGKEEITDTKFILSMYGNSKNDAIKNFKNFTCLKKDKISIRDYKDYEITKIISDYEASKLIRQILQVDNLLDIKKYNSKIKKEYIKKIFSIEGTKVTQLSRILGIDKKTLSMIKNSCKPVPNVGKYQQKGLSPMEVKDGKGK